MKKYIFKPKLLFLLGDSGAVFLSYWVSYWFNRSIHYSLFFSVSLVIASLVINAFTDDYKSIEVRGYLKEVRRVFFYVAETVAAFLFLLILDKDRYFQVFEAFEPQVLFGFSMVLFVGIYSFRSIIKYYNKKHNRNKLPILVRRHLSQQMPIDNLIEQTYDIKAYINFNTDKTVFKDKPVLHNTSEIRAFVANNSIDEIFIISNCHEEIKHLFEPLKTLGIKINVGVAAFSPLFVGDVMTTKLGEETFLSSAIRIENLRDRVLKRLLDLIGGLVGTIVMLIVAALIYPKVQKESKGPLFFKQKRVGKNGKVFTMYKFRSMYLDAEERKKDLMAKNDLSTTLMFKMKDDPRIFPFGQKLRDWSLDELPQFINVLKGDMSLVGTRPPTVDEYSNYELHHFKRLTMKPGITGLWQVSGRSDIEDFEEVIALDLQYIQNWSVGMDIKLLFKTIEVVLKKEGSR